MCDFLKSRGQNTDFLKSCGGQLPGILTWYDALITYNSILGMYFCLISACLTLIESSFDTIHNDEFVFTYSTVCHILYIPVHAASW